MTQPTVRLNQTDSVVLDGSGNGILKMRPDGSREYWNPELISERVSSAVVPPANEAQFTLYCGPKVDDPYLVDATYSGSSGNSSAKISGYVIGRHADPYIIGQWLNGDPGATATMRVQGTKEQR